MANKTITKIKDAAEQLYKIRKQIEAIEEENKKTLEVLKVDRDVIQSLLISDLKKQGISSIKVSTGDSFYLGKHKGVEIVNEAQAFKWAYDQKAVSINKTIVAQILKESKDIPAGFELIETEFISVKKGKLKE